MLFRTHVLYGHSLSFFNIFILSSILFFGKFNKFLVPTISKLNDAILVPKYIADFKDSKETSFISDKYPAIPAMKQSPAPVGSTTLSILYAGAKYVFPSPNRTAPSSPFLIITYLGPSYEEY